MGQEQKIRLFGKEEALLNRIAQKLHREGFIIEMGGDEKEIIEKAERNEWSCIVVDHAPPLTEGILLCKTLRDITNTPLILLTEEISERINALYDGADDALSKPFHIDELSARVFAILRRTTLQLIRSSVVQFDGISINRSNRLVRKEGRKIKLTEMEFNLLELLIPILDKVIQRCLLFLLFLD